MLQHLISTFINPPFNFAATMPMDLRNLIPLVLIASAAVYLVGNSKPRTWDRDESRNAQCSRQMLERGQWVVPSLDEVGALKPPLIYWCQATAMALTERSGLRRWLECPVICAARLPSAFGMLLTLAILSATVWKFLGPQRAFWAILILATSLMTIHLAKTAIANCLLLPWLTIAQLSLYAIWRHGAPWKSIILIAMATALGTLTAGLIFPGAIAFTAATLWVMSKFDQGHARIGVEDRAELPPNDPIELPLVKTAVCLALFLALVVPWLLCAIHRQPNFLSRGFRDVREQVEHGKGLYWALPGYHLVLIWLTFFPWSLFLPLTIRSAWRHRHEPPVHFSLAALLGPWLMLETVMQTKLPHDMLTAFPALAYLNADAVVRALHSERPELQSKGFLVGAGVVALMMILAGLLPLVIKHGPVSVPTFATGMITTISILSGILILTFLCLGQTQRALLTIGGAMLISAAAWYGLYVSRAPNSAAETPGVTGTLANGLILLYSAL